jgi:putative FmdB family regulatory protein
VPTYGYKCGECCYAFERKQRYDEEPVTVCPNCEGKCRRVIHASPVIFKGGGTSASSNKPSQPGSALPGWPTKTTV